MSIGSVACKGKERECWRTEWRKRRRRGWEVDQSDSGSLGRGSAADSAELSSQSGVLMGETALRFDLYWHFVTSTKAARGINYRRKSNWMCHCLEINSPRVHFDQMKLILLRLTRGKKAWIACDPSLMIRFFFILQIFAEWNLLNDSMQLGFQYN